MMRVIKVMKIMKVMKVIKIMKILRMISDEYSNRLSHFEEKMILIILYKDLTKIGYNSFQKEISK
jgi:hypothetical protein